MKKFKALNTTTSKLLEHMCYKNEPFILLESCIACSQFERYAIKAGNSFIFHSSSRPQNDTLASRNFEILLLIDKMTNRNIRLPSQIDLHIFWSKRTVCWICVLVVFLLIRTFAVLSVKKLISHFLQFKPTFSVIQCLLFKVNVHSWSIFINQYFWCTLQMVFRENLWVIAAYCLETGFYDKLNCTKSKRLGLKPCYGKTNGSTQLHLFTLFCALCFVISYGFVRWRQNLLRRQSYMKIQNQFH